jgi:hypothetical protein
VESDECWADRKTASVTANRLVARNVRLLRGAAQDLEVDKARMTAGLVSAF